MKSTIQKQFQRKVCLQDNGQEWLGSGQCQNDQLPLNNGVHNVSCQGHKLHIWMIMLREPIDYARPMIKTIMQSCIEATLIQVPGPAIKSKYVKQWS